MQLLPSQCSVLVVCPPMLQPRPLCVYQRMSRRCRKVLWVSATLAFDQFQSPLNPRSAVACIQVTSVVSDSVQPCGLYPARLLCLWDSPGKNTGVGCHFLFQGNFLTQELNPGLPHWRQMLYRLSYMGSE